MLLSLAALVQGFVICAEWSGRLSPARRNRLGKGKRHIPTFEFHSQVHVCNVIRPGVGYCLLLSVFQYDTQITTFPCCNLFCWGGGKGRTVRESTLLSLAIYRERGCFEFQGLRPAFFQFSFDLFPFLFRYHLVQRLDTVRCNIFIAIRDMVPLLHPYY